MSDNDKESSDNEAGANGAAPSETDKLRADLDKAKKDHLYLAADFENFRKNAIKERSEIMKFGSERIIRDLLSVVDNFELALENSENPEKFREGVDLINQELKSMLLRFGVTEAPAEGLAFDPAMHEALSSEPSETVPPGHVARIFKKAYRLHDKLVRPAQVVVATAPANKPSDQDS